MYFNVDVLLINFIMQDNLLSLINEVAIQLKRSKKVYSRADLAYQLKDYGVKEDSYVLGEMVWKAYKKYAFDPSVFVNNAHTRTIVDEYRLSGMLNYKVNGSTDVFKYVEKKLSETYSDLQNVENALNSKVKAESLNTKDKVSGIISGTNGIQQIRLEADALFKKYTDIIECYGMAKNSVTNRINDFTDIRSDVMEIFIKYSSALVDLLGDRVKIIDPNLFDFSTVQWLDTSTMLKRIELEYGTIATKCGTLISQISESFTQALNNSVQVYKASGDKRIGIITAGINMMSQRMEASMLKAELQSDFIKLQNSVKHDKTAVKADLARLMVIYKIINDVYIPKSEIFYEYAPRILSNEMDKLMDAIYATDSAKNLKLRRDAILKELKDLSRVIFNDESNINYYKSHIEECKEILDSMKSSYNVAKDSKPSKPFILFDIITFGHLGRSYRRELYEWSKNYLPLVETYESCIKDIKFDKEDLEKQQSQYKHHKQLFQQCRAKLDAVNDTLIKVVNTDAGSQSVVVSHLTDIVKLLRLAKEVVEGGLSDDEINVVQITELKDIQLPSVVNDEINRFVQSIKDEMIVSSEDIIENLPNSDISETDVNAVAVVGTQFFNQGVDLCVQLIKLQADIIDSSQKSVFYDKQLNDIKSKFQTKIAQIDDRSDFILQVIKEVRTTNDEDAVKKAILTLLDGYNIDEKDIEDCIKGGKVIEL